jgi:hypothetical protein
MPNQDNLHINVALSNFATQLPQGSFAAPFIAPVLPVEKESDDWWIGGREELDDDRDDLRAPGAAAAEMDWNMTLGAYRAREFARSHYLPHRVRDNADTPIRPQQRTVTKLRGKLDLRYEKRVKAAVTNTANVANGALSTIGGGAKWDQSSGTKIQENIFAAKAIVANTVGRDPNRIVIPHSVAIKLVSSPELLELRKFTDPTLMVDGMLPKTLFGMQLLIPGSLQNTAHAGQAAVIDNIWSEDNVLLFYYEEPSLEYAGFAITFRKRTPAGTDYMIKEWLDVPARGADLYEASFIQDEKVANIQSAYLITDVLT